MRVELPERYLDRGVLGEGRQGVVLLATDTLTGREVAVKVLRPEAPTPLARREVAALLALDLPGVVRLHDVGQARLGGASARMLVLEHVAGEPFPGLGRTSWATVLGPLVALLRVLRRVHAAGVVHRDLKPEHVRVRGSEVVLLDFGAVAGPGAGQPDERAGAGDARYMAPEQRRAPEQVGPEADLYAVGVMVYEALAGAPPHRNVAERLRDGHAPLASLRPDLPAAAQALVDGLLRAAPASRLASAEDALTLLGYGAEREVAQALAHWRGIAPSDAELQLLFEGPERIFRRRSRALAALHARSDGTPEDMAAELTSWLAAGRARLTRAIELSPADLRWLEEGVPLRALPPAPAHTPALPPALESLHGLIVLGGVWLPPGELSSLREDLSLLERDLGALEAAGRTRRRADGAVGARHLPPGWGSDPPSIAALHARWATVLPPGHPRRLRHAIASGADPSPEAILEEVASRHARGALNDAISVLSTGLRAARDRGDLAGEETLLRAWVSVALSDSSREANDRAHYELARSQLSEEQRRLLELLLEAAREARAGDRRRALALLDEIPPQAEEALDRWRIGFAVEAAQHTGDPALQERVLVQAERWAEARGTRTARADAEGWRGMALYQAGRCAEASGLLRAAAEGKGSATGRVSALGSLAACLIELGDLDAAEQAGIALIEAASATGAVLHTATGEWVLRAVAWRRGELRSPDWELVGAAEALGRDPRRAQIAFTEAAFAWRGGDRTTARHLAEEAARSWGDWEAGLMAEALAALCGDADPATLDALADRAVAMLGGLVPDLALQALGLLFLAAPRLRARH